MFASMALLSVSLGAIKFIRNESATKRFGLSLSSLVFFFIGCIVVSLILKNNGFEFAGIYYLLCIAAILILTNIFILNDDSILESIKGKKFTFTGVVMAMGVSAIVFGFLDNFGMKLGMDALDNMFLQRLLGPISQDSTYEQFQGNIKNNLKIMNDWTTNDWRKIVNQTLRYKDDIKKVAPDLHNVLNELNLKPLDIPKTISGKDLGPYIKNIRSRFDVIDDSKAMLGNTFSDFVGALLGAGIVKLFTYLTAYDGFDTDNKNPMLANLQYYSPVMEALFISLGCLIPVFLHIGMERSGNPQALYPVVAIFIVMVVMMFLSSNGIKDMTDKEKKNSLTKTINHAIKRLDLKESDTNVSTAVDILTKENS